MIHLLAISKQNYCADLKMGLMLMSMRMMLTSGLEIFRKEVLLLEELNLVMRII